MPNKSITLAATMLDALSTPGLFITGTDTGVGKTVIAAAIANWFHRQGGRVGVCKIAATGCQDGVSEDAQLLSRAAGDRFPADVICPIRYTEPLAPAVAAQRAGIPLDWSLLQASLHTLQAQSDVLVVEGVGGIMVPMDDQYTVLDVVKWLKLPTVIVARPGLGTINHTLLTINALRSVEATVAGVVINASSANTADISEQDNPHAISRWGNVPILCSVPHGATTQIDTVDWKKNLNPQRGEVGR